MFSTFFQVTSWSRRAATKGLQLLAQNILCYASRIFCGVRVIFCDATADGRFGLCRGKLKENWTWFVLGRRPPGNPWVLASCKQPDPFIKGPSQNSLLCSAYIASISSDCSPSVGNSQIGFMALRSQQVYASCSSAQATSPLDPSSLSDWELPNSHWWEVEEWGTLEKAKAITKIKRAR